MDVVELAKALVEIPSVTGNEAALSDFLGPCLREFGFKVRAQVVRPGRRNIFASQGANPQVIYCTHMDTVPGLIGISEDDTFIYGRGACDAKGIMAAMMIAGLELSREGIKDVGLLFVVGEEEDSVGARHANSLNPGSRFVIVGEPTGNLLGCGHKGILTIRLAATGRRAHSAFPNLGDSAIERLLDVLADLRKLDLGEDPILGPTLMSVVQIEGGVAPNVIPDTAGAVVSLRTGAPTDVILDRITASTGLRVDVAVLTKSEPQVLHTVSGYETVVLPFGSDIPHLKSFGKPLLIGPGSALDAHTEHEKIEKKQLRDAVLIYKDLARRLLTDAWL